jgi:hypothetical protein
LPEKESKFSCNCEDAFLMQEVRLSALLLLLFFRVGYKLDSRMHGVSFFNLFYLPTILLQTNTHIHKHSDTHYLSFSRTHISNCSGVILPESLTKKVFFMLQRFVNISKCCQTIDSFKDNFCKIT